MATTLQEGRPGPWGLTLEHWGFQDPRPPCGFTAGIWHLICSRPSLFLRSTPHRVSVYWPSAYWGLPTDQWRWEGPPADHMSPGVLLSGQSSCDHLRLLFLVCSHLIIPQPTRPRYFQSGRNSSQARLKIHQVFLAIQQGPVFRCYCWMDHIHELVGPLHMGSKLWFPCCGCHLHHSSCCALQGQSHPAHVSLRTVCGHSQCCPMQFRWSIPQARADLNACVWRRKRCESSPFVARRRFCPTNSALATTSCTCADSIILLTKSMSLSLLLKPLGSWSVSLP